MQSWQVGLSSVVRSILNITNFLLFFFSTYKSLVLLVKGISNVIRIKIVEVLLFTRGGINGQLFVLLYYFIFIQVNAISYISIRSIDMPLTCHIELTFSICLPFFFFVNCVRFFDRMMYIPVLFITSNKYFSTFEEILFLLTVYKNKESRNFIRSTLNRTSLLKKKFNSQAVYSFHC